MDVNTEARRIMTISLGKLYSSRSQRGGMKLHRSLLLSLVMRTTRDIYHTARLAGESESAVHCAQEQPATVEQMDTSNKAQVETSTPPRAGLALPMDSQPSEVQSEPGYPSCAMGNEDKENRNPASADRHSRKRRGKAAAEPDFLPSKKARMENGGGESPVVRGAGLRNCNGSSCRVGEAFTSVPLPQVVAAF
ncbi:immediate early response 2b [Conger conger]|uniref:immediate early response 2b n=1 Tax=Conger conger TaxID=82655 RepID=UPI002A5996F0|nr:immediate early response 2b [Conger conger]